MGGHVPAGIGKMVAEGLKQRRPCDLTDAEREALPVGPFIRHERPITREDSARGIYGRTLVWEEAKAVRVTAYTNDDIMWWHDSQGRAWMFGQWADGTWFKQPSALA